jgi:malate dehydrogenase (oxaloacetate-decarboxylating)
LNIAEESLKLHKEKKGKLAIQSKVKLEDRTDLSLAYTPGVAEPCMKIYREKDQVYTYTSKGNLVAVVSDGTAVLGLGNIGPEAAMPVMEGKAILFKSFADVDAFPICLNTTDVDEIVTTVKHLAPTFGGINLEDISAPRCFEIEDRLAKELDIPVFHDDQHGTAIVVLAGMINALKVVGKEFKNAKIAISGAGAAGIAITKLLIKMGAENIILLNSKGIICQGDFYSNPYQEEMSKITNKEKRKGNTKEALEGADVFIGVSAPNIITKEMVASMNKDAIVFAMSNPDPEIMPHLAKEGGAVIIGTGRSDFPNQINNVLAFPGIFRGALDVRAKEINEEMKIAAAFAIAEIITEEELNPEYIIPDVFDKRVVEKVAKAVAQAALSTGAVNK